MRSGLITAAELRDELGEERGDERGTVTVLDVRYRMGGPPGAREYAAGHVPGAAYVDLDRDLAADPGERRERGRHPLPDVEVFETAMRRCGVSNDRPVVLYDDWAGHAAARGWWLLRFHGHRDVRVLDGGWSAWLADGGAIETGTDTQTDRSGDFTASPGVLAVVDASTVHRAGIVIDARAAERYRGEVEPVDPVAGHIPGAVNVPTSSNLVDGRFREPHELAQIYAGVGATSAADVAVYCGSGVTAAHDVLALELAGVSAALYPGSWSEWVADPSRPVATGPAD